MLEKTILETIRKVYNITLKGCEWKSGMGTRGSSLE